MSLYYCPACGQLYRADSAKLRAFCICCGMPTPRKASARQEALYEAQRREIENHTHNQGFHCPGFK